MLPILSGCQSCVDNDISRQLLGQERANYVVITRSGGRITDVYKIRNGTVENESPTAGWKFSDERGNPVLVNGDFKIIQIAENQSQLWDTYHEYHQEFESRSYNELYPNQQTSTFSGAKKRYEK